MEARKVAAAFGAILASTMLIVTLTPTLAAGPRAGYFTIRATGSYETGSNPMVQSIFVRYANWTAQDFRIDNSFMSYPMGPSPTFYLNFGYFSTKAIATKLEGFRIVKGTFDGTVEGASISVSGAPFGDLEMVSADSGTVHVSFQRPIEKGGHRGEFAWITGRAKGNVRVFIPLGDATPPIGFGDWVYFGPEYTFKMVLVEPRYMVFWWDEDNQQDIEGQELVLEVPKGEDREAWVHVLWDAAPVDWKNGVHLSCEFKGAELTGGGQVPVQVQTREGESEVLPEDWPYAWFGHPPAPCKIPLTVRVDPNAAPGTYRFALWAVDDYTEKRYPGEETPLVLTVVVPLPL